MQLNKHAYFEITFWSSGLAVQIFGYFNLTVQLIAVPPAPTKDYINTCTILPTSVGLALARPNNNTELNTITQTNYYFIITYSITLKEHNNHYNACAVH